MINTDRRHIHRMRPALGTFVEISAATNSPAKIETAVNQAFEEITRVEMLMSFHQAQSDIGRVNRSRTAIKIHPWTARVVRLALKLARNSAHRFNPTVGGQLVKQGHLPDPAMDFITSGRAEDIELDGSWIRRRRPVLLTLDGIAKGWAVDRAIARLRACGVKDAVVNAGGDWRCFGTPRSIRLDSEAGGVSLGQLTNGACATSAAGRDFERFPAQLISGDQLVRTGQWTVLAGQAWLADALTKVAAATPMDDAPDQIRRLGGQLLNSGSESGHILLRDA
jgi:thiamine biosynthesis lipoprotein